MGVLLLDVAGITIDSSARLRMTVHCRLQFGAWNGFEQRQQLQQEQL